MFLGVYGASIFKLAAEPYEFNLSPGLDSAALRAQVDGAREVPL